MVVSTATDLRKTAIATDAYHEVAKRTKIHEGTMFTDPSCPSCHLRPFVKNRYTTGHQTLEREVFGG
jgi:hypothetical protein